MRPTNKTERADIMAVSNFELNLKNFYRRMRDLGYTFEYCTVPIVSPNSISALQKA